MIRAILIDPFAKSVTVKHHRDWNPGEVYRTIGSPDIGSTMLTPAMKMVTDEFAPYRVGQQWFSLGNMPLPIAGRTLLLGVTPEGETRDVPFVSSATVSGAVTWVDHLLALSVLVIGLPDAIEKAETLAMPDMGSLGI